MTTTVRPAPNQLIDEARALIAEIRQREDAGASPIEIVEVLDSLCALVGHGGKDAAYQLIWPDLHNPCDRAARYRQRARRDLQRQAEPEKPVDTSAVALFERISWILGLSPREQTPWWDALSAKTGLSLRTLQRKAQLVRRHGDCTPLSRKRRNDAGQGRTVPPDIAQAFIKRVLEMPGRRLTLLIKLTLQEFPECGLSVANNYDAFRTIKEAVPKSALMSDQEWRRQNVIPDRWEPPYANWVWVFDMSIGDVVVWDGDGTGKPYRPRVTIIVDECTRCIPWGVYTKEEASQETLQGLLFHAMLPKDDRDDLPKGWMQHGIPERLRCDNGKVQRSHWLERVCQTIHTDLGLLEGGVSHVPVRTPNAQGHVERSFGEVHHDFEPRYTYAWCGNDHDAKPASFMDPSKGGPKQWAEWYPSLDKLNQRFRAWVVEEYHEAPNRTIKISPREAWQRHAPGHIKEPPVQYLYETLLQRDARTVRHSAVEINTYTYWHERLQSYDGETVGVWWDPADLTRVMVVPPARFGNPDPFWVQRVKTRNTAEPKNYAEHNAQQRQARQRRRVEEQATEHLATGTPEQQERFKKRLEKKIREVKSAKPKPKPKLVVYPTPGEPVEPSRPDQVDEDEVLDENIGDALARNAQATPGNGKHTEGLGTIHGRTLDEWENS